MTRKEFLAGWRERREAELRKMYKDDPIGGACLCAALSEVDADGLRLWRKFRRALVPVGVEHLGSLMEPPNETPQ